MLKHLREDHPSIPENQRSAHYEEATVQSVFLRPSWRFFAVEKQVEDPEDNRAAGSILARAARSAIVQAEDEAADNANDDAEDSRCRDFFLTMTGWSSLLQGVSAEDAEECMRPVDESNPAELSVLNLCDAFLENAAKLAATSTSYIVLKKVGPPEDGKKRNRKGFRPVQ